MKKFNKAPAWTVTKRARKKAKRAKHSKCGAHHSVHRGHWHN